ncbi:Uncharacterised protein [Streptococcus gordonii]|nr:Uncharacterised protein [Streptococcus gordonii]
MIEPNTEDRAEAERIKKEYFKDSGTYCHSWLDFS